MGTPEGEAKANFSAAVCMVRMDEEGLAGPEFSAGLRKLLEAKDCFVRAALDRKV